MKDDLSALANMVYSGRGIIVGQTPAGNNFIGYSLTGRSPSSQARELVVGEHSKTIRTSVTDPEQLEKGSPALLLYPALAAPTNDALIASNGAQTKLVFSAIMGPGLESGHQLLSAEISLETAFEHPHWEYDKKADAWIDITAYEPDNPNFTPRISACIQGPSAAMHIVRRSKDGKREPEIHKVELEPGKGKLITTYSGGNEKPLAPFTGKPLDVVIESNTAEGIAESIYAAIQGGQNPEDNYRVAAAVMLEYRDKPADWAAVLHGDKTLEEAMIKTAIINRSERGE